MSKRIKFEMEDFANGYCEYLSLAFAKLYGNNIEVWADFDYFAPDENNTLRLCHAYNEIISGLYIDALRVFTSVNDIEENYEYNDIYLYTYDNLVDAKKFFKNLHAPYTDKEIKDWIKNFLWTHAPVIILKENIRIAYEGIIYNENLIPFMIFRKLDSENNLSDKQMVPANEIKKRIDFNVENNLEWVPIKTWHNILLKDRK